MRGMGFDDMEYRLKIKEMSNTQLIGTPEGTLVTIIENVIKLQRQGMLISQILQTIENHRRTIGQDLNEFREILDSTKGSIEQASEAVPKYCFYRINFEHSGHMTSEQFGNAFIQATEFLMKT